MTLLSASIQSMNKALKRIQEGAATDDLICKCKWTDPGGKMLSVSLPHITVAVSETKDFIGFTRYAEEEQRYKSDDDAERP